jgi:hypothetical protein
MPCALAAFWLCNRRGQGFFRHDIPTLFRPALVDSNGSEIPRRCESCNAKVPKGACLKEHRRYCADDISQ